MIIVCTCVHTVLSTVHREGNDDTIVYSDDEVIMMLLANDFVNDLSYCSLNYLSLL